MLSINKDDINILTAEDPVEYDLDGISQVQVRDNIENNICCSLEIFKARPRSYFSRRN